MADTVVAKGETLDERLDMEGADTLRVEGVFAVSDEDETVRFTGPTDGASIVNEGTIENLAEEGRAIRFEEEIGERLVADIANSGVIRSDDDAVQIDEAPLSAGRLRIDNAEGGEFRSTVGSALDLGDAGAGFRSHVFNDGLMASRESDGVKIGGFGRIENTGQISGGKAAGYIDGADGITFEDEATGVVINSGLINGDRHAVDAGEGSDIRVVNEEGGVITGRNGSGVGSDGSATVINHGVITGAFSDLDGTDVHGSDVGEEDGGGPDGINDGDGDGVDVDFLATIDNYGVIRGTGAGGNGSDGLPNTSDGIAAGGGVIRNFEGAEIFGADRGILIDNSSQGSAGFVTRIENHGEITGGTGFAVRIVSDLDDVIVNGGAITGGDGVAIQFGSGDNTLAIEDGSEISGLSRGGGGQDVLDYSGFSEGVTVNLRSGAATGTGGVEGFEQVLGSDQDDQLSGSGRGDVLKGGDGDDALDGRNGADTLEGGAGADVFRFASEPGRGVDHVQDFMVGEDALELSASIFGPDAGDLAKAAFRIGDEARDASDRIIYDKASGALLFDADGKGGEDAVQFATLGAGLDLSRDDFSVA
ncbi:hypothetical protein EK403_02715 [Hansschlegelia zhihuaiae]|uniref:Peptidase M10 serralysin C-terminal domain-containing protein n=2 Tax=Hansschlegelia zhihuaiae TaxID=405005 RepID=A0A4Q0MNH9_9HYPH|nr:hypothetical protein EK403_02715 [Hansschlegelia zhihuaiae]